MWLFLSFVATTVFASVHLERRELPSHHDELHIKHSSISYDDHGGKHTLDYNLNLKTDIILLDQEQAVLEFQCQGQNESSTHVKGTLTFEQGHVHGLHSGTPL